MRIRLNQQQLEMIEAALYCHFTDEDGNWDTVEAEDQIYEKISSALEKEKSGVSVNE